MNKNSSINSLNVVGFLVGLMMSMVLEKKQKAYISQSL